jgi:site-specific recombinase XerD
MRCVVALRLQTRQSAMKKRAQERHRRGKGKPWQERGLVFASAVGSELDAHNVRRMFQKVVKAAGLEPEEWTPREMRHSFVSLLSDAKCPSRTSRGSADTAAPRSPNGSTGTRSSR